MITPLSIDQVAREPSQLTTGLRAGDGSPFSARVLLATDADALGRYFDGLSQSVRSMYGPHPLNAEHAAVLCASIDYRVLLPFLALVYPDPQDLPSQVRHREEPRRKSSPAQFAGELVNDRMS